uniref:DUF4485 domain-containing protein n=1 Tax=Sinocyclocheilus anshuiensis TaxID=1608454 RepID=A0A671K7E3_9TELE
HVTGLEQDCFGVLDSEFDHYLVDMKSYVLKLTDKTERQRCALWIKKLCDPETCGSGLTGRKIESAVLPDWVSGELGQADGSWSTSPLSNTHRYDTGPPVNLD